MADKETVILDSTQLVQFLECPMYWNLSSQEHLEKMTYDAAGVPVEVPKEAISIGTFGHKLLEIYYKAKARGDSQSKAIDDFMSFNPNLKELPLDKLTIEAVRQRVREYSYTYSSNDIEPLSEASVEVGFSYPLLETDSRIYLLEGRIDLPGFLGGIPCIVDHKFQMRQHNLYKKTVQFRNYALATDKTMMIVNYIRMTKKVDKDTFRRDIASFTKPELGVWRGRLLRIYDQVAHAQKYGVYEQRWSACSGRYSQQCPFTALCEEWDTGLIESKKQTMYKIKEAFKPW